MEEPGHGILGREDELARVTSFVGSVSEGPSALLLEGAAGIGKTTLWRAGVSFARARGDRVLGRPAGRRAGRRSLRSRATWTRPARRWSGSWWSTGVCRSPLELARTLLVKGEVERRAKRKLAARTTLEQALDLFQAPTEQRIAQLVGEGKKNREVAEALFISVKTVEANLSRIFHKLGVRSRTELTRRIAGTTASDRVSPIPHRSTGPSLLARVDPDPGARRHRRGAGNRHPTAPR